VPPSQVPANWAVLQILAQSLFSIVFLNGHHMTNTSLLDFPDSHHRTLNSEFQTASTQFITASISNASANDAAPELEAIRQLQVEERYGRC
jgi:hypothetical protein